VAAVERLLAGERGVMVGMRGQDVIATPLAEVAGAKRRVELDDYRMARRLAK